MAPEDVEDPEAAADTDDDRPGIGGWLLRASDAAAVIADLKAFGQVFQFPVPAGERAERLAAGQPCFLYVEQPDDPAVKPGIWAVGEVVGPTFDDPADPGHLLAEVELLPLLDRIRRDELTDHAVLSRCELFAESDRPNPFLLRRREVRALEEWEFAVREPTPEQVERLDAALAAYDT